MRRIDLMEDGGFTHNGNGNGNGNGNSNSNTMLGSDFNIMDELLYDGFWLETTTTTTTTDGSNFWQPSPTLASNDLNSAPFYFPPPPPISDNNNNNNNNTTNPTHQLNYLDNPSLTFPEMDDFSIPSVSQSTNFVVEETEVNKRLWVRPHRRPIRSISVKKKLVNAINHLKESIRDKDILIQIWVPVKRAGRQVLTTTGQPFSLNKNCKNLVDYRDVSTNYQFAADEDSKEFVGLPGRVFLNKLPEWTPDVRFFKREEYPRVNHAQQHDVRGSLALPVFEQGSGNCLGVVEIVTTSQKVNYRPELENICKALEAVDLKSSNILSPPIVEDCNETYHAVLAEIRNVLKCVCDAHALPLAQTWAPCIQQDKGGCRHSDENYTCCVSTVDSACYVADQQISGFHEACSEHHLLRGEGIAGRAFLTNQPCFAEDITAFRKTEYPLAHHARVFNLCAAVAIRLRSTYTGEAADFVLEFFLPLNCKDSEDQRVMLDSLSSVIQRTCQSLRVVTDEELAREKMDPPKLLVSHTSNSPTSSSWIMHMMDPQHKGKGVAVSLGDHHKEEPEEEFKVTTINQWDNNSGSSKLSAEDSGNFYLSLAGKANSEKRRTKSEKTISLQVLRQYFAGSLKDAARNIGVCPTTLKRICRQHGITRWPSRKIKKVGHSLRKLQVVIDSVQGAEGSIQLSSFYNNFPELVSPNNNVPTSSNVNAQPEPEPTTTTTASKSPSSSGSHSSSSTSYCCSTGVKQSSLPSSGDNALSAEQQQITTLKRARSDAELHDLGFQQQEPTKLLVRSYSHKIFSGNDVSTPTVLPKNNNSSHQVHNNLGGTFRVKAAFGEEKIRLSLQPHWVFKDLQQEVFRRFNIDSSNGVRVDLKYLDDDSEWVLLTCDADLEECIDIHRSSKSRTIKLSLNQPHHHPSLGSSFGSNCPY